MVSSLIRRPGFGDCPRSTTSYPNRNGHRKTSRLTLDVGQQGAVATIENALSRAADFGLKREVAEKIALEMAGAIRNYWQDEHRKAGVPEDKLPALLRSYRLAETL